MDPAPAQRLVGAASVITPLSPTEQTVLNRMREIKKKGQWADLRIRFEHGQETFIIVETKEKL
jgi:hypothetical protein